MLPIKIERKTTEKYPNKRNNYRKYKCATWCWEDIFIEIYNMNNVHEIPIVAIKYNIKKRTLQSKIQKMDRKRYETRYER